VHAETRAATAVTVVPFVPVDFQLFARAAVDKVVLLGAIPPVRVSGISLNFLSAIFDAHDGVVNGYTAHDVTFNVRRGAPDRLRPSARSVARAPRVCGRFTIKSAIPEFTFAFNVRFRAIIRRERGGRRETRAPVAAFRFATDVEHGVEIRIVPARVQVKAKLFTDSNRYVIYDVRAATSIRHLNRVFKMEVTMHTLRDDARFDVRPIKAVDGVIKIERIHRRARRTERDRMRRLASTERGRHRRSRARLRRRDHRPGRHQRQHRARRATPSVREGVGGGRRVAQQRARFIRRVAARALHSSIHGSISISCVVCRVSCDLTRCDLTPPRARVGDDDDDLSNRVGAVHFGARDFAIKNCHGLGPREYGLGITPREYGSHARDLH